MSKAGKARIGTSNIVVPGSKKTFPPAFRLKSRLHYYSQFFNTLEVNSCFYKTPLLPTYARWAADVPGDFQFSLKLSKQITHVKNLVYDLDCMNTFMQAATGTGNKKGCLLVQFPGKISLDHFTQVEQVLEELQVLDPSKEWRVAVEFRNSSWYTGETYELLDQYGAALVLHDIPKARISEPRGNAAFVYIRFHGPKGDYRDSYPVKFLEQKAIEIREWLSAGKDVYAYFNNTIGSSFENAVALKTMLL